MKNCRINMACIISKEDGNMLVYVLVAVVLFGALSFALSHETHNSSTAGLEMAKLQSHASGIIGYTAQAKSVIDQMTILGSSIDELDFSTPDDSNFNIAPHQHKLFHPLGGGLDFKTLSEEITVEEETEDPGWYVTSSINVEWSPSSETEVILVAYQINEDLCKVLNRKITGSTSIPALSGKMRNYFIDTGSNNELTTSACADCEGYSDLCVTNSSSDSYSFYSILAAR